MREFEYTFAEGLRAGLRRDKKNPRNSEALVEAFNVRVGPMGIEPYEAMTNILDEIPTDETSYVLDGYVEADYVTP